METLNQEKFTNIEEKSEPTILTGIPELDNWFSTKGGMVIGSAIFLTGSSGSGKTTLMTFLAKMLSNVVYSIYSREMPKHALKEQVERLKITSENLYISDAATRPTFESYVAALDEIKPKIVVVDSVQVIAMEDFPNVSETKAIYHIIKTLREWTDKNNAVLIIIGHVTKDDVFRGDNTIMQMFDAHMEMIFDKKAKTRTLSWGQKNRKGPMGDPLYYEFEGSEVLFYTEDEWNAKTNKTSLVDFVQQSIVGYLRSVNKKHPNYAAFSSDLNMQADVISQYSHDGILFVFELMKVAQELLKKHNMN